MSFLRKEIARDLKEIERDWRLLESSAAQTFTWGTGDSAIEIPCVSSSSRRGVIIQLGPSEYEVQLTLIVRYSHFITGDSDLPDDEGASADSDVPHPWTGKLLVFQGWTYRILSVRRSPNLSHYEIDLADNNSNR